MSTRYLKESRRHMVYASALLFSLNFVAMQPVAAKHRDQTKGQTTANIFTPTADQMVATPVFVGGNGKPIINKPIEEPRWENAKALPDLKPEQSKAINKLQEQYNKTMASIRNEMNDANQKLKNLKDHKPVMTSIAPERLPTTLGLMTPDGKPYMGPLLGDANMASMETGEESVDEVQAHIDSLKQEISELNRNNDNQLKATLTADQLGELDLMRQGKLIIKEPKNVLADAHATVPTPGAAPQAQSTSDVGARILGHVLRSSARSLIYRAATGGF